MNEELIFAEQLTYEQWQSLCPADKRERAIFGLPTPENPAKAKSKKIVRK